MFVPPSRLSSTIRFRPEAGKSASFQFIKNFRPEDIGGITLRLDASDTSTLTLTGPSNNEVLLWIDKLSERTFIVGRNRPYYSSTGFNGLPAVLFSQGRNLRNDTSAPYTLTTNDSLTIFIVGQLTSSLSQKGLLFRAAKMYEGGPKTLDIGSDPNASFNWFGLFDIADIADAANNQMVPNNVPSVLCFKIPAGASFESLFLNADPAFTSSSVTRGGSDSLNVVWDEIFLGVDNPFSPSETSSYWNGPIAEIIVYDSALSESNIVKVSGYLGQKWGFKASLTAPYDSEQVFRPVTSGPSVFMKQFTG